MSKKKNPKNSKKWYVVVSSDEAEGIADSYISVQEAKSEEEAIELHISEFLNDGEGCLFRVFQLEKGNLFKIETIVKRV